MAFGYPCDVNDFYDYARLSALDKLQMAHKGVICLDATTGDTTVGIIPAEICYVANTTNNDLPGKIGGPNLDFDNSLTYSGAPEYISAPMGVAVTSADAVKGGGAAETDVDYTNLREEFRSEDATVTVEIATPDTSAYSSVIDPTFEYSNDAGLTWVAATGVLRWDMVNVYTYTQPMPATSTGSLVFRLTFAALSTATVGDYIVTVKLALGGVQRFSSSDTFALS